MTDQKQVYRTMMAQGFAKLSPAIGQVRYAKGEEYRDANGNPASLPEEPKPTAAASLIEMATRALPTMEPGKLAAVAMGDTIDHDVLAQILDGNADEILAEYTNGEMKEYLESQGVDVGQENKAGLLQLIEALHAA